MKLFWFTEHDAENGAIYISSEIYCFSELM